MLSSLRMGALHFGTLIKPSHSSEMVNFAVEQGVRQFDVSPLYGNGDALEILAHSLAHVDNDITISLSIGMQKQSSELHGFGVAAAPFHAKAADKYIRLFEQIAKRSFCWIINIHSRDENQKVESLAQEMKFVFTQYPGIKFSMSNISPDNFSQLNSALQLHDIEMDFLQVQASVFEQRLVLEASNFSKSKLIINRPFSRGLLTREYSPIALRPSGSRSTLGSRLDHYLQGENANALFEIRTYLSERGLDARLFSLYWLIGRPGVKSIVFGARSMSQLVYLESLKETNENVMMLEVRKFDEWINSRLDLLKVVRTLPRFTFEK